MRWPSTDTADTQHRQVRWAPVPAGGVRAAVPPPLGASASTCRAEAREEARDHGGIMGALGHGWAPATGPREEPIWGFVNGFMVSADSVLGPLRRAKPPTPAHQLCLVCPRNEGLNPSL